MCNRSAIHFNVMIVSCRRRIAIDGAAAKRETPLEATLIHAAG